MKKAFTEDNELSFDDDVKLLDIFNKVEKENFAREIIIKGDDLLSEIKRKEIANNIEKQDLIKKIRKKDKTQSVKALESYSIADVRYIYEEIKSKKSALTKAVEFIFGLD